MAAASRAGGEIKAVQRGSGEAATLAAAMPRLILESRRIAATVIHGLHGRRRAGSGENFWQYRRFTSGEPARRVDWRRSARDDNLYVREHEWEAAHTIWIWPDRSASMNFVSPLAKDTKLERAIVVAFALAEILVQTGERVGIPGLMRATAARNVIERMADAIVHDPDVRGSLPPAFAPAPFSEIVMLSDFWAPIADLHRSLSRFAAANVQGHIVQIVDPAEETFPYSGRVEFFEPESAAAITAGRAENWRADYVARLERHRAELRSETGRLHWSFGIHRTDRTATELLLALHARIGASPGALATDRRQPAAEQRSQA
jgi:uncharacterized protein (DUF58 family)